MTEQRVWSFAGLGHRVNVFARDDEDMHRRLRIDVGKGVALVVLVDGGRRNASIDDLAEEAAHGSFRVYSSLTLLSAARRRTVRHGREPLEARGLRFEV